MEKTKPTIDLSVLRSPGLGFKPKVMEPIAVPMIEAALEATQAAQAPAADLCPHCHQPMPVKVATVAPAVPVDLSVLDAEWNSLERDDLEPRDFQQVRALIAAGESELQREKRILNDKARWIRSQGR